MIRLGREIDAAGVAEMLSDDEPVAAVVAAVEIPRRADGPQLTLLAGGRDAA